MPTVLVATSDGLFRFADDGSTGDAEQPGRAVTALGRADDDVLAIVDAAELWRVNGSNWVHVADLEGLRATCVASMRGEVFVGTSEARLFRLEGERLRPVSAFDEAQGRETWHTPWGGPPDTRSMANWDVDVYVNVHVGGIPRTDDGGATWTPTIDIGADVHQVTTAEGRVLAACAVGLATSADRGATWSVRTDGLEAPYARAVAVCGDAVLVTASEGPRGGHAAVYRGNLAGGAFERCRSGLPEWFEQNIDTYCLDALPDGDVAAFGTTSGRLYRSRDGGRTWDELSTGLPAVRRVLVMP